MKVFKFGGASLRSASGIQQVGKILAATPPPLVVVVSAMGKTTNLLEQIHFAASRNLSFSTLVEESKTFHLEIVRALLEDPAPTVNLINNEFDALIGSLGDSLPFDAIYDQVVSKGEVVSSIIVAHYLQSLGLPVRWADARRLIATDQTFREGKIDWEETRKRIRESLESVQDELIITQGFIGGTTSGLTTTLGREGSDFSAAIFASCLDASSVTIWKDVPGVMNADPKRLPAAVVFDELPFREAAEMTYYGASVIHPKTIKPLANKGIPLLVKNFDNPDLLGTRIHECVIRELPPLIVFKENQCLISCKVTDYSFVNEQQLFTIFQALHELDIRINMMQNSAISFSFCIDFRETKIMALLERLQQHFEVYYNTGLTLVTVKNYDPETFESYRKKPGVILEQSSRSTLQVLIRNHDTE
jgi:aspartate kinase